MQKSEPFILCQTAAMNVCWKRAFIFASLFHTICFFCYTHIFNALTQLCIWFDIMVWLKFELAPFFSWSHRWHNTYSFNSKKYPPTSSNWIVKTISRLWALYLGSETMHYMCYSLTKNIRKKHKPPRIKCRPCTMLMCENIYIDFIVIDGLGWTGQAPQHHFLRLTISYGSESEGIWCGKKIKSCVINIEKNYCDFMKNWCELSTLATLNWPSINECCVEVGHIWTINLVSMFIIQ